MSSQHAQNQLESAPHLEAPSPMLTLLGLIVGSILLAAVTWLGITLRGDLPAPQVSPRQLRIVDAQRALIFDADTASGDVRVLNVRSGVSEIARLHEHRRQNVSSISLDAQRNILTVVSSNERYQYDAHSFRLLTRSPLLAASNGHELGM